MGSSNRKRGGTFCIIFIHKMRHCVLPQLFALRVHMRACHMAEMRNWHAPAGVG